MRKMETDYESMDWFNLVMNKFWVLNEPTIADQVVVQVNKLLADSTPGFLDYIALDTFTLGTKPFRVEHVRTFPKTEEDIVVMDWKYSFTPHDTVDKTFKQLKTLVNPNIQLRIGKFGLSIPIVVQDMAFTGLMRIRLKLVTSYPHIKTVDAHFITPPQFDYVMKPIGGKQIGFDVNSLPGLQGFVSSMADSILGPMMYAPNSYQVNIQELLAGGMGDAPAGVLAVSLFAGNALKGGDGIDPYVAFSLNGRKEMARSKTQRNTKNPRWNETKYLIVHNLSEALTLSLYDFNDYRKDKYLGTANFPLETLADTPTQENLTLEVLDGNKSRGSLNCSVSWFPALEEKKLEDGTVEPPPESNNGIVNITIHQVKDLDTSQSMVGQYTPYADLLYNGELLLQTKHIKRKNNAVWDEHHEFLVTDRRRCKIGIRVKDSRDLATDPVLGIYQGKLDTILNEIKKGNDWFSLNTKGRVRLSASWHPVELKGAAIGRSYVEPIGAIRIHCMKTGEDLRNVDKLGKVDPYIRVFMNGFQRARTMAVPNTMSPSWDEILYIPIQSPSQRMVVEAMDAESRNDRSLGLFEINTSDFIKSNEKGEYLEYVDPKPRTHQFQLKKKSPKGSLVYTISFFPDVNVLSPDEAEELRKEAEAKVKAAEEAAAKGDVKDKEEKKTETESSDDATLGEGSSELDEPAAKDIPLDELTKVDSGILALTILEGKINYKDTYLRFLVDDSYFPSFVTPKLSAGVHTLGDTAEFIIRELNWSQLTIQLTSKAKKVKKDDILAEVKISTLSILRRAYYEKHQIQLKKGDKFAATINLRARYFPLLMQLDPSESVGNMGELQGEIVKADNVPAADRSGYSDPYTVIMLNGEKVFKTEKVKKTLNPVWNAKFSTEILSRTKDNFVLKVWDWDIGPGDDDFLGEVQIDLAQLEPLTPVTLTLPLKGESGTITVKLLFKPSYVSRRVDSSGIGATFSNGAAIPGKLVGSALGAAGGVAGNVAGGASNFAGGAANFATSGVGAVAGGVTGGVGAVAGGMGHAVGGVAGGVGGGISKLKNTFRRPSSKQFESEEVNSGNYLEPPSSLNRSPSLHSSSTRMTDAGAPVNGQISIHSAQGFSDVKNIQIKAYVVSGRKEKEIHKTKAVKSGSGNQFNFDESFSFKASSGEASLVFKVKEHKALGRSEDLGEGTIRLAELQGEEVEVPVGGSGSVKVSVSL